MVADDEGAEGGEGPPEGGGGDVARDTSKSMQTELEVRDTVFVGKTCCRLCFSTICLLLVLFVSSPPCISLPHAVP